MTIVDFYKELSRVLTRKREYLLTKDEAKKKILSLLEKAEESNLEIKIDIDYILDDSNILLLDDERSFEYRDEDDSSSYEDYDSSY
jgi:hypothetical protein